MIIQNNGFLGLQVTIGAVGALACLTFGYTLWIGGRAISLLNNAMREIEKTAEFAYMKERGYAPVSDLDDRATFSESAKGGGLRTQFFYPLFVCLPFLILWIVCLYIVVS